MDEINVTNDPELYAATPMGVHYGQLFIPKENIADLFIEFGGSFVRSLGESLRCADLNNTYILLETFKEKYVIPYIKQYYTKTENEPEKIVASAIKYGDTIVPGKRHGDAIFIAKSIYKMKRGELYIQGFITNYGRFLDRQEACKFAQENGQIKNVHRTYLYSEDLRGRTNRL